jgi:peptide/nickel transport system permease protein
MLKNHPTLRYILTRGVWYFLTFLVAITINFFLPRLGPSNPVDVILAKAGGGMSDKATKEKEEAYLKEFGLAEVDKQGNVLRNEKGTPVGRRLVKQFCQLSRHVPQRRSWYLIPELSQKSHRDH